MKFLRVSGPASNYKPESFCHDLVEVSSKMVSKFLLLQNCCRFHKDSVRN